MYIANTRLAVAGAGGTAPHNLNFAMQSQDPTNWCWAVVTASIASYYDQATTWSQCALANRALQQSNCCANGRTSACNQPWYLDTALQLTGHLAQALDGTVPFSKLQNQIGGSRPVAARIAWLDGSAVGHFVVIYGYSTEGGPAVSVRDSLYGDASYPLDNFTSNYKNLGYWSATYLTQ